MLNSFHDIVIDVLSVSLIKMRLEPPYPCELSLLLMKNFYIFLSINRFVFCTMREKERERERSIDIGISESQVAGRQSDLEHPQLAGV